MEWKLTREPLASLSADAIVVFHFQKRESLLGVTREIDEALGFRISNLISLGEITGKFGEITTLHNWGEIPSGRVFVVGLGKEGKLDLPAFKDAVAAARTAKKKGIDSLGIGCPSIVIERYNPVDVVQSVVEGMELGTYEITPINKSNRKRKSTLCGFPTQRSGNRRLKPENNAGQIFSKTTNYARYLVHEPGNRMTPDQLAEEARQIAEKRN